MDDEGQLVYSPFFVGTVSKIEIDLNKKSQLDDYYIVIFNSLEEIRDFKKTPVWESFKDKDSCKIRRVFVANKENKEFVDDIFALKMLKIDVSKCGYSLLEILALVSERDAKLKEVLKSKKEIKRLIESGAVKIIKEGIWTKKENPNEYFISQEELIFKIGKTTFFKIK
jgi:tyrosyl-tRNA synthetase